MDIVSRLKIFMTTLDMTNSQFADLCHIPRPSISQLLNGRNKKISDEIITKIHDSFPELSILWLMFGEGDMMINSNIKISAPLDMALAGDSTKQRTENKVIEPTIQSLFNHTDLKSENFSSTNANTMSQIKSTQIHEINTTNYNNPSQTTDATPTTNKRISNIVVFYDDNSFESFTPSD